MKRIVIIGGGASGMFAAIAAATTDATAQVSILEKKEKPGKKILSTGNGRCNLTNEYMELSCFRSDTPDVIAPILEQFTEKDTIDFFENLGVLVKSRNGYIYPRSDQASTILEMLQMRLHQLGVQVHTEVAVKDIMKRKKDFQILTSKGTFQADRVVLATGGKAASVLGSDGSGYGLAKKFGHQLAPVVPALVQLKTRKNPLQKAAGVRVDGKISAYDGEQLVASDTGELQLTAYGISGIPTFQVSRYLAKALYYQRKAEVAIDFVPYMSEEQWQKFLTERRAKCMSWTMNQFLTGIFHQKLIPRLLEISCIPANKTVAELTEKDFQILLQRCKHTRLTVTETNGFENAQVCAGGVYLDEIDTKTMESKIVPGLYLVGELLDVDGICGGYNLQWAWTTGKIAGTHAVD